MAKKQMNKKQFELTYWNQYLLLEKEFITTTLYVELDYKNYSTYSKAYLKLLLSIGSEFDNVLREICGLEGRSDISAYAKFMLANYPNIVNQVVETAIGKIQITPFDGWNTTLPAQSLSFWNSYNEIKHDRISNYYKASLENTLNALAGLFTIEMYRINELYASEVDAENNLPKEESSFLILHNWENHFRTSKIKAQYPIFDDDEGRRLL